MNASAPNLRVQRLDGVARLTLNRPEKRNALDAALIDALARAFAEVDAADDVQVVALAGEGPDFCSGLDLSALQTALGQPVEHNLADADTLSRLFLSMRRMRKPVVALVRGRALAGGCGLATACDLVLAAESASFGYTEVAIGLVPATVMALLSRNVPEKRAFELIAGGEILPAAEAERIGLINRVFADAEFEARSEEYLRRLASRSGSALWLAKRLLYRQADMSFEAAVDTGAEMNVLARMSEDVRAGVERFLETRTRRRG